MRSAQLFSTPLRRPRVVWLAVLLTLFGALAPALSHAVLLARGGVPPVMVVCTSQGVTQAAPNPNTSSTDSSNGQESALFPVHCPFCLPSTDRAALPPPALFHHAVAVGEHEEPTIRQAFLCVTHFAPTPPPRGPPVSGPNH